MNDGALTISQAAKACGLTPKTIRYYEQIGLIPRAARHNDVARTGSNRFYRDEDLRRLRFIRSSRLLGLGLNDVSALLAVSEGKGCPGARSLGTATRWSVTCVRSMSAWRIWPT